MEDLIKNNHCMSIFVNEHKQNYENIRDYIDNLKELEKGFDDEFDKKIIEEIIKRDTIIEAYVYPTTPIGSYKFIHYDFSLLLEEIKSHAR
jgi:hypothetical protein